MFFKNIFYYILNSIYKNNCCLCNSNKAVDFLCKSCAKTFNYLPYYSLNKIEGVNIYSCFLYEDNIKKLIHNYKFKNKKNLSFHFASFLYKYFNKLDIDKNNLIIVPVPSHKNRINKRGYDHILNIVKDFSKLSCLKYNDKLLIKIKDTKPQFSLNKKERKENIKNSFNINLKEYKGENILIIDDIITTGSTLNEIINEFYKNKIYNINCLTLSKA